MEDGANERENSKENSSMAAEPIDQGAKSFNQAKLFKALEVVERDPLAIAESYNSLFASLRLALSEGTGTTADDMHCFSDAAGKLQEAVIDTTTRGTRFVHSCIWLNEEMKGIDALALEIKVLRRSVDALDSAVNRRLRITK